MAHSYDPPQKATTVSLLVNMRKVPLFIKLFKGKGVAVDYMPAHTVQVAFPQTDEELAKI